MKRWHWVCFFLSGACGWFLVLEKYGAVPAQELAVKAALVAVSILTLVLCVTPLDRRVMQRARERAGVARTEARAKPPAVRSGRYHRAELLAWTPYFLWLFPVIAGLYNLLFSPY